jgi:integrase
MARWDDAAPATWNRHLSALTSFTAWAQRQELLATNPARHLERRRPARRGDRAVPRARLEKLFSDDRNGLRERILWRMLYETAARAEEILSLNVEDHDTGRTSPSPLNTAHQPVAPNNSYRVCYPADSGCGGRRQVSTAFPWAPSPDERSCPCR